MQRASESESKRAGLEKSLRLAKMKALKARQSPCVAPPDSARWQLTTASASPETPSKKGKGRSQKSPKVVGVSTSPKKVAGSPKPPPRGGKHGVGQNMRQTLSMQPAAATDIDAMLEQTGGGRRTCHHALVKGAEAKCDRGGRGQRDAEARGQVAGGDFARAAAGHFSTRPTLPYGKVGHRPGQSLSPVKYAACAELLVWARKLPRACAHGWRLDAGGSPSLAESLESNQSNDIVYFNNNQIASSTDPGELSGAQSLYFNAVRAVVVLTGGARLQGGQ